jgi:hypothetical protein
MQLIPAYGRDYKNKAEVEKDFYDNKDFIAQDLFRTGMINRQDLLVFKDIKFVNIRYAKLTKVHVVRVEGKK